MTTSELAKILVENASSVGPVQVFTDRLLLRLFSAPGLISYLKDVNIREQIVELDFLRLPDQIVTDVVRLIGDGRVSVHRYEKNNHPHTGFKIALSPEGKPEPKDKNGENVAEGISNNPKYHDKQFQYKANTWWRSLSMNDWDGLKRKHGFTFSHNGGVISLLDLTRSDIAAIYDLENQTEKSLPDPHEPRDPPFDAEEFDDTNPMRNS